MADEDSTVVPAAPSEPTIRKMGGATFSLLLLLGAIAYIQPWIDVNIPDEIRYNLLIRNGYVLGMKPMFLFMLHASQKVVISVAVLDTILNRRAFFGLFTSFGIYIGMGVVYLLIAQADIPSHYFCAIVLVMSILGMLWCFKQFSKNRNSNSGKIFQLFKDLKTMFDSDDGSLIDRVIVAMGMVASWVLYFVDIIFFVIFFIQSRTAFF